MRNTDKASLNMSFGNTSCQRTLESAMRCCSMGGSAC